MSYSQTSSLPPTLKFLWRVSLSAVKIIPVFRHSPVRWAFSTVGPVKRYRVPNVLLEFRATRHTDTAGKVRPQSLFKTTKINRDKIKLQNSGEWITSSWVPGGQRMKDLLQCRGQSVIKTSHDPKFFFWRLISCIKLQKASRRELKVTKRSCFTECMPVSFCCASQWALPGRTVDKKGQREARGYPLLTGYLWRAQEAAPESSLMVEMDARSPCGVIPFTAKAHLWYMARRRMPAREAVGDRGDWTDSAGWCGGRA